MARFILLWVKKDENVEPLMERLSVSKAVKVVGLFADPRSFCDRSCGRQTGEAWRRANLSIIHKRWGTEHCPLCKKVIRRYGYNLRNSLDPLYLPGNMSMLSLNLKDVPDFTPYDGRSVWKIFGKPAVKAAILAQKRTEEEIEKYRVERDRRKAKSAARRSRRSR